MTSRAALLHHLTLTSCVPLVYMLARTNHAHNPGIGPTIATPKTKTQIPTITKVFPFIFLLSSPLLKNSLLYSFKNLKGKKAP
jgi:hypothetical protein